MLKIIVNSDHNLEIGEPEISEIEETVQSRLKRFEDRLTRVVIHLSDEDGGKSGQEDIRCMMEARPEGMGSVNVSHHASAVEVAVNHAAHKLERSLDDIFSHRDHKRG